MGTNGTVRTIFYRGNCFMAANNHEPVISIFKKIASISVFLQQNIRFHITADNVVYP